MQSNADLLYDIRDLAEFIMKSDFSPEAMKEAMDLAEKIWELDASLCDSGEMPSSWKKRPPIFRTMKTFRPPGVQLNQAEGDNR